jgi:hypothetical protein
VHLLASIETASEYCSIIHISLAVTFVGSIFDALRFQYPHESRIIIDGVNVIQCYGRWVRHTIKTTADAASSYACTFIIELFFYKLMQPVSLCWGVHILCRSNIAQHHNLHRIQRVHYSQHEQLEYSGSIS